MNEAEEIKMLSQNKNFNEETLSKVLSEENKKTDLKSFIKLKRQSFGNYFSEEMTTEEITGEILKALDFYREFKEKGSLEGQYSQITINENGSMGCVLKDLND